MHNKVYFRHDHEYRALSVVPENNQLIKQISVAYYEPGLVMPMHTHNVGQLSTLLTGQAKEQGLRCEFDTHHGLAQYKPVAYRHSNKIGPRGAIFLSVNINSEHADFLSEYGPLKWLVSDTKASANQWQSLLATILSDKASRTDDVEEKVLSLLNVCVSSQGRIKVAPHWLALAQQAVIETPMSAADIADDVGVHRVHLCRAFQAHFGLSISQYRQRTMLQTSLASLISDNENIVSASAESGFADQSHFTRTLKKQFGITPRKMKNLFVPGFA